MAPRFSWLHGFMCLLLAAWMLVLYYNVPSRQDQEIPPQWSPTFIYINKCEENRTITTTNGEEEEDASSPTAPALALRDMKPEQKKWQYGCNGSLRRINFPLSATTRNLKGRLRSIRDLPLIKYALHSIAATIEPEKFDYAIYVGADDDDAWLANATRTVLIVQWWEVHYKSKWGAEACVPPLEFFAYDNTRSNNVRAVNHVSQVAYERGFDFFFRINDDSVLVNKDWSTKFVEELARFRPIPYLGVTGPWDAFAKGRLLTHSFVGRLHFKAMGIHFATLFQNVFSDDWIQRLYTGPYPEAFGNETRMVSILPDVKVRHMVLPSRYDIEITVEAYRQQVGIDRNNTLYPFIMKNM